MSRFHDEFFRAGSPEHDALMIKCTSEKGIDKILNSIDLSESIQKAFQEQTQRWTKSITICHLKENKKVAWRGAYLDWVREEQNVPHIRSSYISGGRKEVCDLADRKKCGHSSECAFYSEGKRPYASEVGLLFEVLPEKISRSYETEVIVRNGNFIVGYADAVIKTSHPMRIDATIEDGWAWNNYGETAIDVDILVEAKPKLSSIGEVIRQLKTYKSLLQRVPPSSGSGYHIPILPVIVTYTKLDNDAVFYIQNEGIKVVVFEGA